MARFEREAQTATAICMRCFMIAHMRRLLLLLACARAAIAAQPIILDQTHESQVFGETRAAAFPPLPKWRRNARRPSCLDLVTVLRQEVTPAHNSGGRVPSIDSPQLVLAASA